MQAAYCKLIVLILTLGLAACGGGSGGGDESEFISPLYSGSQSASTITEENSDDAAEAAIVGAEKAISDSLGGNIGDTNPFFKPGADLDTLTVVEGTYYEVTSNKIRETVDCDYGGNMVVSSDDLSENSNSFPSSGEINTSLNDCDFYGGAVINGRIQIAWTGGWDIYDERGPRNFVISYNLTGLGESESGSLSCQNFGEMCSTSVDFEENGQSYRVDNPLVTGDSVDGYSVEARVYNQELGYLDISATGLVPCPAAGFSSGVIEVVDSSDTEVLELTFIDCDTYQIAFGDSVETRQQ